MRRMIGSLRRRIRNAMAPPATDLRTRIERTGLFAPEDIDWVCNTYFTHGAAEGGPWDLLRHAHMTLPAWFQQGLDPWGTAYAEQQHRLWQLVAGVEHDYVPEVDEKEHSWAHVDPVRTPGFYARRDPEAVSAASDHVLATGMLLKHCGLKPGDWALEYGAGFGQSALALARLGVNVDTVDISTTFCDFVRQQAECFQVPLTPFHGRFGTHPRPEVKYRLIWFYESFHHCVDFQQLVPRLHELLAEGGKVILGGEPIMEREYAAVPYPWGVRLHSEVVAVVRRQHWFELGFTEAFLFELFARFGFSGTRIDCEPSLFGRLYVFERDRGELTLAPASGRAETTAALATGVGGRVPSTQTKACTVTEQELSAIPEVMEWAALPLLPTALKLEISQWANDLEYANASAYDLASGHDFAKNLPTDWATHLQALGVAQHERVLDVGTGTGRCRLSAVKGGYTDVYGLDSSQDCLEVQARSQQSLGLELRPGQLLREVPEHLFGTFAAVCMSSALHHIADLDSYFAFVGRLLKPGGVFVASAEPTNMRRYNAMAGIDTKIRLRDIVRRMRAGDRQRTHETTLIAEFHVGAGFSRDDLATRMRPHGLEVESWNVYQWLSYVAHHHARNSLPPEKMAEFAKHYEALIQFDQFMKDANPAFAQDNYFTLILVARKS
jgi:SAM-dependent methyltransferase